MGFGIRMGSKGAQFKSFLIITSNPNTLVTATFEDIVHSGTTDSQGNITFIIKKKGTYSINSGTGAQTLCFVNKTNRVFHINCLWDSTISATANPGETVTAVGPNFTYSAVTPSSGVCTIKIYDTGTYQLSSTDGSTLANVACLTNGEIKSVVCRWRSYLVVQTNANASATATTTGYSFSAASGANGVATITIKKSGNYSISTTSGGSNSSNCNVNGATVNSDAVFVGTPSCYSATWATCVACLYWGAGSYYSGMRVKRNDTVVYSGAGNSLKLSSTQTVTGYNDLGLTSGTQYTYTFNQYYTINSRSFYSPNVSISYTAVTCSPKVESYVSSTDYTFVVPEGARTLYIYAIGGGGGGGAGYYKYSGSYYSGYYWCSGGGGGGGGYIGSNSVSVLPGESVAVSVTIGGGGSCATRGAGSASESTGAGYYAGNDGGGGGITTITAKGVKVEGSGGYGGGGSGYYESVGGGGAGTGNGGSGGQVVRESLTAYAGNGGDGQSINGYKYGAGGSGGCASWRRTGDGVGGDDCGGSGDWGGGVTSRPAENTGGGGGGTCATWGSSESDKTYTGTAGSWGRAMLIAM